MAQFRFYWTCVLVLFAIGCASESKPAAPVQTAATQPSTQRAAVDDLPPGAVVHRNLAYVANGHERQSLDLYLPPNRAGRVPVVIWLHGGGWSSGNKSRTPAVRLLQRGYAVASVGYRLTDVATFPAQIHDCKAAVRFLRGSASKYGLDTERIGVWGASAGGNLALLLGVGSNVSNLEGIEGDFDNQTSVVACVVDYFGTVEFRNPKEFPLNNNRIKYMGGTSEEKPEIAALVTPLTHISADDAPVLIVHGDKDNTVPINHSRALESALKAAGVEHQFLLIPGGGHGGDKFHTAEVNAIVDAFLDRHLKPTAAAPPGNRSTSK
jgi:acetyl esterase/lipase